MKENTAVAQPDNKLIRLPEVLERYPVSRSKWYEGINKGYYPKPVKLGARISAWKASDIDALIQSLGE